MSNNPDKGHANGSCNRTACQAPLAAEPVHQFMDGNFTGGPRLHYCEECARDFDKWDAIDSPGQPNRIKRETKDTVIDLTKITNEEMAEAIWNGDDWPNRLGCTFENLRQRAHGEIEDKPRPGKTQEDHTRQTKGVYDRAVANAGSIRDYLVQLKQGTLPPQIIPWNPHGKKSAGL